MRAAPTVVHLTTVHRADDNRIYQRQCRSLARAGYRVALVAPAGGPAPADDLVPVLPVTVPAGRVGRVLCGVPRAWAAARRMRADVYHLHDPELLVLAPVLRLRGARVVYDAHEDLPNDVLGKFYLSRPARVLALALAHALVRAAGQVCHHVVAATTTVALRFPARRCTIVRNYPLLPPDASATIPHADRSAHVVYVGTISVDRGLHELLDAVAALPDGWRLQLVGPCRPARLADAIRDHPARARVDHHGPLPPGEVWTLLARSRIGVVVLHPTPAFVDALPTKLFEYMAAGLAVVASDFPLWRSIVTGSDSGLLVDPTDPRALAAALRALALDPAGTARHGRHGRDAVRTTYRWEIEEERLLELYAGLTAGTGTDGGRRRWDTAGR